MMASRKAIEAARVRGARIQDSSINSWIREERENPVFPFPWSQKSRMDFWRPFESLLSCPLDPWPRTGKAPPLCGERRFDWRLL